jgi:hypothetical protein
VLDGKTCAGSAGSVVGSETSTGFQCSVITALPCVILTRIDTPAPDDMLIHLDDFVYDRNETGKDCAECMRNFSAANYDKFSYACEQYCMNPYTIRNGRLCSIVLNSRLCVGPRLCMCAPVHMHTAEIKARLHQHSHCPFPLQATRLTSALGAWRPGRPTHRRTAATTSPCVRCGG